VRVDEDPRLADQLRKRAASAGHDRRSTRHRFDDRQTEALVPRRQDQDNRGSVQLNEIRVRNESGEGHARLETKSVNLLAQRGVAGIEGFSSRLADQGKVKRS